MSKKNRSAVRQLSRVRRADPYFEREAAKYPEPLPSREYILQLLEKKAVPLEFIELCSALEIQIKEQESFRRRLGAMAKAGQLMQNRAGAWLLPAKAALIRGRIEGHPDGFGFLIPDERAEFPQDIFLSPVEMETVLHGDRAMVRVFGVDRRGRPEGKIVEVIERRSNRIVGRVFNEHGVWFVVAENRRISQDILLAPAEPGIASPVFKVGQVVMVEIIEPPRYHVQPIGRITEVIGSYADPGMEIEIALRKHELPFEFPPAVEAEARKLPAKVRKLDWKGREDLTALPLVTIDGETARDFDDAVYCECLPGRNGKAGGSFRLVVAIADVSHYVKPQSAFDQEAWARGNSVYFPRRVIPMLPEKLSNDLCSLNPEVERLCMVCDMQITTAGHIEQYRFYPAVMRSQARLTYTEVAAALYDKDRIACARLTELGLLPHLETLDKLYRVLAKARKKRGAIDFETTETQMIFDAQGKIARIEAIERNEAHRLIEECMLAANVCAADFIKQQQQTALYRVHEGPSSDRLQRLREFLAGFGLQLGGGESPSAKDYALLLEQLQARPDKALFQTVMLRSLRQAQYTPDNCGHFGLSYEAYAHFTSPIRRYPDLVLHRVLKGVWQGKAYRPALEAGQTPEQGWQSLGQHCSMTERRADEATRDVEAWLKCYYMQDRINEEYDGRISAVVPFGLFITLDEVFVEGLVHVSDLGNDYFHFDEVQHAMVGERTGRRFRLSDRIRVRVVKADLETNRIDFRLSASPPGIAGLPAAPAQAATKPAPGEPQPVMVQASGKPASAPDKDLQAGVEPLQPQAPAAARITPMPVPRQVSPPPHLKVSAQSSTRPAAWSEHESSRPAAGAGQAGRVHGARLQRPSGLFVDEMNEDGVEDTGDAENAWDQEGDQEDVRAAEAWNDAEQIWALTQARRSPPLHGTAPRRAPKAKTLNVSSDRRKPARAASKPSKTSKKGKRRG